MTLKYRKDYVAPHYRLNQTQLDFTLHPTQTIVRARLHFDAVDTTKPILLNGQFMTLKEIAMDGKALGQTDYILTNEGLTLVNLKQAFVLETTVQINPEANTRLMGLYMSGGMFCTQCEPEGFRNITYYPDHSDVTSKFTVTIRADRKKYPVLLSNGNKIKDTGDMVVWEDPFNKPCYLFALVAGDLDCLEDTYQTGSGKTVALRLYCERGKGNRLTWAMESLKRAMAWDEKTFGLEYDLDLFNIVAVSHFNAGAMENKSLNIFNDAALLASPDTATDANYENIEETVAHEYFHNYSGDRVTLRDWFELSLKEGFTVFRHEEFACDTHSRPVRRIDQVSYLKMYQFPEDDGPLAHPVRPDSYHEIENFYTVTVYEKGAELIRMQQALLGKETFFKACALYFKRHDGQAVTIDDFVRAMEDASGRDLKAFKRWYSTAGRPRVRIKTHYDETQKKYTVRMTQSHKTAREPFVIPMVYGLVGPDGRDMRAGTLVFDKTVQEFVFEHVPHRPVLSVNRYFTAPIDVDITYSDADRMHLMMYDSDLVNRFEVGAEYVLERLADMVKCGADKPDETILKVIQTYLTMEQPDKAFIARGIALPAPEEIADRLDVVKPADVLRVYQMMRQAVADTYRDKLLEIYRDNQSKRPYSPDSAAAAGRAVKNVALGYLALTDQADLVFKQYRSADNLTDKLAALSILVRNDLPEAAEALEDFYRRYETEDLVLNKWFAVQARAESERALETVKRLVAHPKFDYKNPNKVRAVVGAFSGNLAGFHASDGSGYRWYAEQVLRVDKLNPNLSARLLTQFSKYKRFDEQTRAVASEVLRSLAADTTLSGIARETLERML